MSRRRRPTGGGKFRPRRRPRTPRQLEDSPPRRPKWRLAETLASLRRGAAWAWPGVVKAGRGAVWILRKFWPLLVAGMGVAVSVDYFWPSVHLGPTEPLAGADPLSVPFRFSNDGKLTIDSIRATCYLHWLRSSAAPGLRVDGNVTEWGPPYAISLGPGEYTYINCESSEWGVGKRGHFPRTPWTEGRITIVATYKIFGCHRKYPRGFQLAGDSSHVRWVDVDPLVH
jgi:hypothetical protein